VKAGRDAARAGPAIPECLSGNPSNGCRAMLRAAGGWRGCSFALVQLVGHFERRLRGARLADLDGGNAGHRDVGLDVVEYDRTGGHARAFADGDVADDDGAGADQYPALDLRMAITAFLAGSAECD